MTKLHGISKKQTNASARTIFSRPEGIANSNIHKNRYMTTFSLISTGQYIPDSSSRLFPTLGEDNYPQKEEDYDRVPTLVQF